MYSLENRKFNSVISVSKPGMHQTIYSSQHFSVLGSVPRRCFHCSFSLYILLVELKYLDILSLDTTKHAFHSKSVILYF